MKKRSHFEQAQYIRQVFEAKTPPPKYCGACYFIEDWDVLAPGLKPRMCYDCANKWRVWYQKLDKFIEEHSQRFGLVSQNDKNLK